MCTATSIIAKYFERSETVKKFAKKFSAICHDEKNFRPSVIEKKIFGHRKKIRSSAIEIFFSAIEKFPAIGHRKVKPKKNNR